jgi:hypothetical protein
MHLSPSDIELHTRLGIDPALLDRMQVRRVDDRVARETLGINGRAGRMDGVLYPYIDPFQQQIVSHRLRRDTPDYEDGKPRNKYLTGYGDRRVPYLACEPAVLADVTVPAIGVEAEKSVLAITSAAAKLERPMLPIGLGGCYGWRGRIGKVGGANGERVDEFGVLPMFDRIVWPGRRLTVCFDSNAATNPTVQSARRLFAAEFAKRGAAIHILDLHPEPGINGPDDFIGRYGIERFFELLDAAPDAHTFDVIFRLNRKHAVVREAGKTVVITEERDQVLNRDVLLRSTFADLRNYYLQQRVAVGKDKKTGDTIYRPLGHAWLEHRDRRQYEGIVMSPGHEVTGYLNLWRGFAVQPAAGDWSKLKEHIFEVICSSNVDIFDYVLAWMAAGVQHPDQPAEVAMALRGPRGAGKGIFARSYGELFGQHYLQIANTKHLTGNFNAHLRDAVVLFADEAFWAGDKAGESVLKMLITEPVIPIEPKGFDIVLTKNFLHIILASNNDWIVPAGMDERRFLVLDVDGARQSDFPYFAAIVEQLNQGGRAAMLHELLQYDGSAINLRAAPHTEALRHQKVLSLSPNERWLFDKLMAGRWLPEHDEYEPFVAKDALHEDYVRTLQKAGVERRSTETELGMFMTRMLGTGMDDHAIKTGRKTVAGRRQRGWTMPNLSDLRAAFDRATRSQHPWPPETPEDLE